MVRSFCVIVRRNADGDPNNCPLKRHSTAGAPVPKPFNFEGIRPAADHRRYAPAHVKAIYMSWSRDDRSSGPRGYHHGNLKEALLRAALELIAQKGPAGFTFAEAARWAGVSPAAPYRHFRDRYELLASVALRGFEHFAIVLEQAWDDGRLQPFAALDRLGKAYLEFARTEPAYYSAMFEAGIPLATSPELREAGERAFAILRGASERLCAQMPPQSRPWSRCIFGPCHTALPRCLVEETRHGAHCRCRLKSSLRRKCWSTCAASD